MSLMMPNTLLVPKQEMRFVYILETMREKFNDMKLYS